MKEFCPRFIPNGARYATRIDANILDMGAELVARFDSYVEPTPPSVNRPLPLPMAICASTICCFLTSRARLSGRLADRRRRRADDGCRLLHIHKPSDPQERRDCEYQLVADYLDALGPPLPKAIHLSRPGRNIAVPPLPDF